MSKENGLAFSKDNSEGGLQAALLALLAKQARQYTMGDSSSVPVETAQELLRSVCFVLGIDEGAPERYPEGHDVSRLEEDFRRGLKDLAKRVEEADMLWQRACLTAPKIENIAYRDTLRSLRGFRRRYDSRFFAHLIPCDIDYQLCHPVPDKALGVDFVREYLRRILIENSFLARFDPAVCVRLLEAYCRDYRGLLINLYEPAAVNAIGLALLGKDPRTLDISPPALTRLEALFRQAPEGTAALLRRGAEIACDMLAIGDKASRRYIEGLAGNLLPRVSTALDSGGLSGIFISFGGAGPRHF